MKRILAIVLALAMVFALSACSGSTAMTMGTGGTAGTYYGLRRNFRQSDQNRFRYHRKRCFYRW